MTGPCKMLDGNDYRSINLGVLFVAALFDCSADGKKTANKRRVHTHYSEIIADVTKDMAQYA